MSLQFRLICSCLTLASVTCLAQTPLQFEREIPLPGVIGRIDHLSADVDGQRLFVAALENGTVEVADIRLGRRTAQIKGLKEPQGLLYLSANHTLYVATGGDGTVRSFDGATLAPLNSVRLGDDADNLRYAPSRRLVLAGYGSGAIALLDPALNRKGDLPLRMLIFNEHEDERDFHILDKYWEQVHATFQIRMAGYSGLRVQ